ncbi:3-deoxy-7-phosphoheptulonate synthase [Aidingimonas halophila]|uniref:Phospho-2-dehydro-3-deoxyheptonate aldolase n=1 Tax=Aidingimonas halophila TaxID=574349 RepID=A0A1H2VGX4_9GAMM|nr:3-deoxy-7-phosphoheptulonate synthase [Aidingimonas halophila]GHC24289.1 phospho-2-dehydro-3-deoxyheptonate aldolase [Aidingimonas halophila]SDW67518.1 3-deoxy-D-arabinoheptulosonate-7-phosphate synthase [Aidingimonas halophila]
MNAELDLCDNDTSHQTLPTPNALRQRLPVTDSLQQAIDAQRDAVKAILDDRDDRMLVIVGPCSIHDPRAALEYAERLAELSSRVDDQLLLVMRAYVEKPRTTVGWKGLAYDPYLDGSNDMAYGLQVSRSLLRDITALGLPVATELLQPMVAAYLDDLLAWTAIGARTTESQIHRELASGLEAAVGFKNATDGGLDVAIDAMCAAAHPQRYFAMDRDGRPAMRDTRGNSATHAVLRGGHSGPNYHAEAIARCREALRTAGVAPRLMVDCSHANSCKDHRRQGGVLREVLNQRLAGEDSLIGVMLESSLQEGKQSLSSSELAYGVSITDACLGWDETQVLLQEAAERLRYD